MNRSNLKILTIVLVLGAIVFLPGVALAITTGVLNFDDVPTSGGWGVLPTDYGGSTWGSYSNITARWEVVTNTSAFVDFPSSPNAVFNGDVTAGGDLMYVSSETPFNFTGAWFGTFRFSTDYAYGINVIGMLGESQVYNTYIPLTPGVGAWTQLDMNNIDRLVFNPVSGPSGRYFLMDNFTITPTPIPGAVWLLGSGLIGLVGIGRKRFKK